VWWESHLAELVGNNRATENLELITQDEFRVFSEREPRGGDYIQPGAVLGEGTQDPHLSPGFVTGGVLALHTRPTGVQ
jgi:hypothetical protein